MIPGIAGSVTGANATPPNTLTATAVDTDNLTIYNNFTNIAIGAPHAKRYVVVTIMPATGSARTVDAVTIGGASAAAIVASPASSGDLTTAIWGLLVPAGYTATIEVTLSGSATACVIGVYAIYPASTTPVDSGNMEDTNNGAIISNIATTAGGWAIACSHHSNNNTTTWAWNGGDSVVEDLNGSTESENFSTVHFETADTATADDMSVTWVTSNNGSACIASWGPQ